MKQKYYITTISEFDFYDMSWWLKLKCLFMIPSSITSPRLTKKQTRKWIDQQIKALETKVHKYEAKMLSYDVITRKVR